MSKITYIATANELKRAIKNKDKIVAITNSNLATKIRLVKLASKASFIAAIGLATTAIINPSFTVVLLPLAAIGTVNMSPLVWAVAALIVLLGAGILKAIYYDYDVNFKFRAEIPHVFKKEVKLVLTKRK